MQAESGNSTSRSNKDHIEWPSYSIEDTLISTDSNFANTDEDGWGEPKETISWESPKFSLIERQRSTRFWNPNQESEEKTAVITRRPNKLFPWRRRREDVFIHISKSSIRRQSPTKDPNLHFAKILEPEEFEQWNDSKSPSSEESTPTFHAVNGEAVGQHRITELFLPESPRTAPLPSTASSTLVLSSNSGRSRTKQIWNAIDVHLLDGMMASIDFAPLTPTAVGQSEPDIAPASNNFENEAVRDQASNVIDRMKDLMDEPLDEVPYPPLRPTSKLVLL